MPIYGAGSNWNGEEKAESFIDEGKFILGWNEESAKDLYSFIAALKVGDILYLKANQPGSRKVTIKGIGIITKNLIQCISEGLLSIKYSSSWESLFVLVKWLYKVPFIIEIPENEGKLTNTRAATFYEEYLPFVQEEILNKIGGKQ